MALDFGLSVVNLQLAINFTKINKDFKNSRLMHARSRRHENRNRTGKTYVINNTEGKRSVRIGGQTVLFRPLF